MEASTRNFSWQLMSIHVVEHAYDISDSTPFISTPEYRHRRLYFAPHSDDGHDDAC